MSRAVVLFSGGQDSTTALVWALREFGCVTALLFDYGQRHRVELAQARHICVTLRVPWTTCLLELPRTGALLDDHADLTTRRSDGLPASFVPARNAVFLAHAAAHAAVVGAGDLVVGFSQVDYSGYPDCREDFRAAMERALTLALPQEIRIRAPLINLSKAETVRLAVSLLGEADALALYALTHTCYEGSRPACGVCPACKLRLAGFAATGLADPLAYREEGARAHRAP